jgi:hypothetical protein
MGKDVMNFSSEQQEVLDSGLRMLAQMIAATHKRRLASEIMKECAIAEPEKPRYLGHMLKSPGKYFNDMQSEDSNE